MCINIPIMVYAKQGTEINPNPAEWANLRVATFRGWNFGPDMEAVFAKPEVKLMLLNPQKVPGTNKFHFNAGTKALASDRAKYLLTIADLFPTTMGYTNLERHAIANSVGCIVHAVNSPKHEAIKEIINLAYKKALDSTMIAALDANGQLNPDDNFKFLYLPTLQYYFTKNEE